MKHKLSHIVRLPLASVATTLVVYALSRQAEVVSAGGLNKPCAESHLPARGLRKTMGGCGAPGAEKACATSPGCTKALRTMPTTENPASRPSLLHAIRLVESGDRLNPPDGDGGRAIGPYQIWRVYWRDSGVPGDYQQCRDRAYAERVILAYWRCWCPKALAAGDWRTLANVHHLGGPAHNRGETDEAYLRRVKASMQEGGGA